MTSKYLGSLVSGYLDPDLRSFETTVFQSGKPVLDKELNLASDIANGVSQLYSLKTLPSGWLGQDFLASSDNSAIFTASGVANEYKFPPLTAHVNGWFIEVNNTGAAGLNKIDMGAAPTGTGIKRTDLVILEVWRRLLSPAPDTAGKSHTAKIWRQGNVKIASADDVALNLTDDLKDGTLNAESTKRVQVQYRLRVLPGVDLFTYPFGINDPTVVAYTVPAAPASPNGASTAFGYSVSTTNPGLWVAGDGDPSNTLGTVDGYMYALPLSAIFRRNQTAFDRVTNHNGGSGRPDSLTHSIFVADDIVDLRSGVSLTGWDYREVLDKNLTYLFDNALKTEWKTTTTGGYVSGHTTFSADEVGLLPGNSTTTGTTGGGNFIGQFDCGRRVFSDRPIGEVITVTATTGGTWATGDTVTLDVSSLDIYPYTSVPFASRNSGGFKVSEVLGARFIGSGTGKKSRNAPVASVVGLNDTSPTTVAVKLGSLSGLGLTNETLYVDLLVVYPPGQGLSKTPTADFGSSSYAINNPSALLATAPISYEATTNLTIDGTHRETQLLYRTVALTVTLSAESSATTNVIRLPERALAGAISSIKINNVSYGGVFTLSADGRSITMATGSTSNGDEVEVIFKAVRPLPQNAAQFTIYYQTRAPQTVRDSLLGTSLTVLPRYISPYLYVLTQGSGSLDEGFPFPQAYVQTGGVWPSSSGSFAGDHDLNGNSTVSVADFSAHTGLIRVMTNVPYTPNSQEVSFTRLVGDVDAEGRTFFKTAGVGVYVPSAFGQVLSHAKRHKVILPVIAELTSDSSYGRKGMLVLMLVHRWASFDDGNYVAFDSDQNVNTTSVSVIRLKGNLLNRGS